MDGLDDIDHGILHLLQEDARDQTPVDMAEKLPVSDQTVRNRIEQLEEAGVIEGYLPVIDYEKAGFSMRLQFSCTAPVQRREELAEEALEIPRVVNVEEMLAANENLRILAVTKDTEGINEIAARLDDLGLTIEKECLQRHEHKRPFNHFGQDAVSPE